MFSRRIGLGGALLLTILLTTFYLSNHLPPSRISGGHPPSTRHSSASRLSCNPLFQPGFIAPAKPDPAATSPPLSIFTPYSQSPLCPPLSRTSVPSLLPYLRNRRIYFYGDSVTRNAHFDFCKLIGSDADAAAIPNPPGYRTTGDHQAIHICEIKELNFSAVNVYTYGLRGYDESDIKFLTAHGSINHKPESGDKCEIWGFENRMSAPQEMLTRDMGKADVVFLSSGLWDLVSMQQHVMRDFNERGIEQSALPPKEFLDYYETRVRGYVQLAKQLHAGTVKKVLFSILHTPQQLNFGTWWGMDGNPHDNVKFSGTGIERVEAVRDVQYAVVEAEGELAKGDGKGVEVKPIPFDRILRSVPEQEPSGLKRMRDDIHPSELGNELLGLAILGEMRRLAEEEGVAV